MWLGKKRKSDVITKLGCLWTEFGSIYLEDINTQPIHYLKLYLEDDTVYVILYKVTAIYAKMILIFNIYVGKEIFHNDIIIFD